MAMRDGDFILVFAFVGSLCLAGASDPPPLVMPGHVTVGVLAELRQSVGSSGDCEGPVSGWALQEVAALEWALSTINNQSSTEFTIGLKVYDSCGDQDRVMRQASTLLVDNEKTNSPLLGIVALGSSVLAEATVNYLHAYSVPLLTTHAPSGNKVLTADNVFTTAPHLYAQIQAVIAVIIRQRRHAGLLDHEHRLGVMSGCEHALKIFDTQGKKAGIEINSRMQVSPEDEGAKLAEKTLDFIKSQVGFQGTVVVLMEANAVNALAEGMFGQLLKRSQTRWVFAVLDGEPVEGELKVEKMHEVFPGAVIVEPYSPLLPGLNHHLENALRGNHSLVSPLLPLLKGRKQPCTSNAVSDDDGSEQLCSPSGYSGYEYLLSGTRATAAVKAVSSFAAAFRLVQIDKCATKQEWCPQAISDTINSDMMKALRKLSYSPQGSSDRIRYTADGRLVSSFTISRVTSFGLQQVGKYREDTGVVWTHPLPGMREPEGGADKDSRVSFISPEGDGMKTYQGDLRKGRNMPFDYLQIQEDTHEEGIIREILLTHQDYISRAWALSVLIISCVGILCALYIGVYVAVRYCDGTIAGPQMFGGLLLLGVVCVYASCIVYILPPSAVICRLRAWLPNLALTLCFSVLLVKAMQLRALVAVGLGGEVAQTNLYISLLFMMGVEVALTLLGHREILEDRSETPLVELDANGMRQCRRDKVATLISQDYLLILLVFGIVLGVANKKIQRNHNEGRWLLLVSGVSTPVVLAWAVMSFLAPPCLEPPTTCAACITLATAVLVLVFIPKMRVIARQARDFKHKRLTTTPSLSTIFTQLDMPTQNPLQPPAPFCDTPYKHVYPPSDTATLRSSYHGDVTTLRSSSYPCDMLAHKAYMPELANIRTWRDHLQESPCLPRQSVPPPPPPPVRNPLYYDSTSACYP